MEATDCERETYHSLAPTIIYGRRISWRPWANNPNAHSRAISLDKAIVIFPRWSVGQLKPSFKHQLSLRIAYNKVVVTCGCSKHVPVTLIYSDSLPVLKHRTWDTGFGMPNLWVTRQTFPPYSTNNLKIAMFKHRKSSQIFWSKRTLFATAE